MTLRIFFNPERAHALFRLQAMIPLAPDSGSESVTSHPFHLQLQPEYIHSLRLDDSNLHFHLTGPEAISLIGPASIPIGCLRPTTSALSAMALLCRQRTIVIRLSPARARQHAQSLTALCGAVATAGTQQLRADPVHLDLRGLYRGRGGRFVAPEEILNNPGSVDDVPPSYADVAPSIAPISPGPSTRRSKRVRTRSPSESESETPTALKQLSGPDRAKVRVELLRQLDDREKGIRALLEELDVKSARATSQMRQMDEQAQRLTELTAAAAAASSGRKESPSTPPSNPRPPEIPRSSPSPSTASSSASKISTRIQAYIETQLQIVREEMRAHNEAYVDNTVANHATTEEMQTYVDNSLSDYATIEAMESHVNDELDGALSDHVEEFQMYEAITEAVDSAIEGMRERVMAAWDR